MLLTPAPHISEACERVGLSNILFCNSGDLAARFTPDQILTRQTNATNTHERKGLEAARAKVQAAGYNGKMSQRTRSKVSGVLSQWFTAKKAELGPAFTTANAVARRFTFATLTLCAKQAHSDNYLKRHGLGRFLQEVQRGHGPSQHFWRAEAQHNGNLHFHILFARELPWKWLRDTWNTILSDLGYIAAYTAKMQAHHANGFAPATSGHDKRTIAQQVAAYREGVACAWTDPNSTDIHRLAKTKNAAAYVCKYVSKDAHARKVEGRIWGCSDELRLLKVPELLVTAEFLFALQHAADIGTVELIQCDHVAIYRGNIKALLATAAPELLAALNAHYAAVNQWLCNLRPQSCQPPPNHPTE